MESVQTVVREAGTVTFLAGALFEAPFGPVWVATSPAGLVRIDLHANGYPVGVTELASAEANSVLALALDELAAYFARQQKTFTVPVDWASLGLTPFQRRVLEETSRIPWGEVVTYGALARAIGRPQAARAVGQALGNNPVPIVIPCHRVIAASGSLQGYGAGLDIKAFLLRHEGVL